MGKGPCMKSNVQVIFDGLFERYPQLLDIKPSVEYTFRLLKKTFLSDGKLLLCGNGGSDADCNHIVGELMKGFKLPRCLSANHKINLLYPEMAKYLQGGLPAISLGAHTSFVSAYSNDVKSEFVFAQQILGYYKEGDSLICISTSGNSLNVVNAAKAMKALGGKVIGLTGEKGGELRDFSDVCICVPEKETFKVQELHLPIYHTLCMMLEREFFSAGE